MEQFRQIGEVLGSLKAQLILQDDILINPKQCCLLYEVLTQAFTVVADEIKQNLKFEERNTKWKSLEEPLKELFRVFREAEGYIRRCLDNKDWWAKVLRLHHNKDSLEFHVHQLISLFPAVIEAIETASEISGLDQEEMHKKRILLLKKYETTWNDPKLFEWRFGRQYLLTDKICSRFEKAVKEDKLLLLEAIIEKKTEITTVHDQRFADMLLKKIHGIDFVKEELFHSSIMLGSEDYYVRRRLGDGRSQFKEIHWLGESFVLRHFFEDVEPLSSEISMLLSLSHTNIVRYLCGFYDEMKKETLLVMELMSKDLYTHIREHSSPRRRALFPLPVVVDMMLQIARGMEYLHFHNIYIGDLNPSKIFIKPRKFSEGYFHVKISGYGLRSVKRKELCTPNLDHNFPDPGIWLAPEVLAEQENHGGENLFDGVRLTEKADVYSYGMLCFELLTGKLPFEDGHLHGAQMIKNIRTGERPLFPSPTPRYLVNLTRKCWHSDPRSRPSFTSICRILRYTKKFLALNPSEGQPSFRSPQTDYCDLETGYLRMYPSEPSSSDPVSGIPFQMFVYRLMEREKSSPGVTFNIAESISDDVSNGWKETVSIMDDQMAPGSDLRSTHSDFKSPVMYMKSDFSEKPTRNEQADLRSVRSEPANKKLLVLKKSSSTTLRKLSNKPKTPPPVKKLMRSSSGPTLKMIRESTKLLSINPNRKKPLSKATEPSAEDLSESPPDIPAINEHFDESLVSSETADKKPSPMKKSTSDKLKKLSAKPKSESRGTLPRSLSGTNVKTPRTSQRQSSRPLTKVIDYETS